MTSIERSYNVTTLTDGTFIGINMGATNTAFVYSNFTAPPGVGGAGSVFDFQTGATQEADALLALVGLSNAVSNPRAIAAGNLFRDMGDRYVFSANGSTVAIVSGMQSLTNATYEGAENKLYSTTWCAQPLGVSNVTNVGLAKL